MNAMNPQQSQLTELFQNALLSLGVQDATVILTRPKDPSHGDYASNVALTLAKRLRRSPADIARDISEAVMAQEGAKGVVGTIEIAGPGFINVRLAQGALGGILSEILTNGEAYGRLAPGSKGKIIIEYVSANPTGPLHLGHARQGALGDVLSAIFRSQGYDVCREFYYNDAGVQIDTLTESVRLRALEENGEVINFPENGYKGDYIRDIARDFLSGMSVRTRNGKTVTASGDVADIASIRAFSVAFLQKEQDEDLKALGISFDSFYLESSLYTDGLVQKAVDACIQSGYTYEKDGALWLRTTNFPNIADDKDRVMRKSDGHYTYFVPDIAYHLSKFMRGFKNAIDIQGSDHHGTTSRVRIGVQIVGKVYGLKDLPAIYPHYILHKMLKVVKDGEEVKMSKRAGTYVTLKDLVTWVGKDAARYFLVSRKADTEFVFDVNLALSKSDENPVYYLQYAHARICSIFKQAQEKLGVSLSQDDLLQSDKSLLQATSEQKLIVRLAEYPGVLALCVKDEAPHFLCTYLKDLAADFHAFYNDQRVLCDDPKLTASRLSLVAATRVVLENGFKLLGIEAPERM